MRITVNPGESCTVILLPGGMENYRLPTPTGYASYSRDGSGDISCLEVIGRTGCTFVIDTEAKLVEVLDDDDVPQSQPDPGCGPSVLERVTRDV